MNNNNAAGGIPQHQSQKPYITSILAKSPPRGQSQSYKRLTQAIHRQELTTSLEILAERGIEGNLAIFIISDRRTSTKYLRAGCCDAPLRECPNPDKLLRSPNLTAEERQYLAGVAKLDWFSGQVAAVLLQIEAKVQQASVEVAA